MSKMPRLICIAGPDGSGKTTQLTKLAEHFAFDNRHKVAAVTIWDMLLDPEFRPLVGFSSPKQVDQYLGALSSEARSLFLFHCLKQALSMAIDKNTDVCLINAYWYKYYATEIAHGAKPELLKLLAEQLFPEPELTFYLELSPEESYIRKGESMLSSYETGFAEPKNKESFVAFQKVAQAELDVMANERKWIRIDGSLPAEKITERIIREING